MSFQKLVDPLSGNPKVQEMFDPDLRCQINQFFSVFKTIIQLGNVQTQLTLNNFFGMFFCKVESTKLGSNS